MPVRPMGRCEDVAILHRGAHTHLGRLLADCHVQEPRQLACPKTLFDFLLGGAKEGQDHVASIEATLDGEPLQDVMSYRVASDDLFQFTGDASMEAFDSCITGSRQPAVVDSFFIVLKPLRRGTHELTVRIVSIFGTVFGPRTITLDVG